MDAPQGNGGGIPRPVRLLEIKGQDPLLVRFLEQYRGKSMHYFRGRYIPCSEDKDCPIPIHRSRTVWKAWAAGELFEPSSSLWWPQVIEVTEGMDDTLQGRRMRGEVWAFARVKAGNGPGKIVGQFVERHDDSCLRAAFDIHPVLCRFYHVLRFDLGTPNPMPPRLLLEPADGELPAVVTAYGHDEPERASSEEWKTFREAIKGFGKPADKNHGKQPGLNGEGPKHV